MADEPRTPKPEMPFRPEKSSRSEVPPMENENYQDYAGALRIIASARSLFLVLLVLSLLVHAGAYTLARWSPDVLGLEPVADRRPSPKAPARTDAPPAAQDAEGEEAAPAQAEEAKAPAAVKQAPDVSSEEPLPDETALVRSGQLRQFMEMMLPLAMFVGLGSTVLLLGCYLLSVNVALSGRLGGVQGSLAALIWMAVVLLLIIPWAQCADGWGVPVPGVYVTADQLMNLPTEFVNVTARVIHYVRYLGYPLLIFLVVVAGDRRYARGYRLAHRQIEARVAVRRI
jgi:hypothetical protein